jgi:CAAX protease family protein
MQVWSKRVHRRPFPDSATQTIRPAHPREPDAARSASARQAVIALLAISIILSVAYYRDFFGIPLLNEVLLFLVVPLLVIVILLRRNPADYGLRLGRWRKGLAWTVGGILLMSGVAWLFMQLPAFRPFYTQYFAMRNPGGDLLTGIALSGVQMFVWEFLFRGFLLFALADLLGPYAIWIQMVPFVMAHFGKPEWETYTSIPGGLLSGWIAYRVGSFYPSWLIHWALAIVMSIILRTVH